MIHAGKYTVCSVSNPVPIFINYQNYNIKATFEFLLEGHLLSNKLNREDETLIPSSSFSSDIVQYSSGVLSPFRWGYLQMEGWLCSAKMLVFGCNWCNCAGPTLKCSSDRYVAKFVGNWFQCLMIDRKNEHLSASFRSSSIWVCSRSGDLRAFLWGCRWGHWLSFNSSPFLSELAIASARTVQYHSSVRGTEICAVNTIDISGCYFYTASSCPIFPTIRGSYRGIITSVTNICKQSAFIQAKLMFLWSKFIFQCGTLRNSPICLFLLGIVKW